jgi:hypothetical protein
MERIRTSSERKAIQGIALIFCVVLLGVGGAACGSSGGTSHTQNSPTSTAGTPASASTPSTAPPTTAPKSGGAGF